MIPLGGMCERLPFAIGGSGSMYVYGYVDSQYKENMTKEQCLQFTANSKFIFFIFLYIIIISFFSITNEKNI